VAAVLAFALLPHGSGQRISASLVSYWAIAVFAAVTSLLAARRASGKARVFWGLLAAGLLCRFSGYALVLLPGPVGASADGLVRAAYVISYLLLLAALLVLVADAARGVVLVAALDACAISLTVGMLAWTFFADGTEQRGLGSLVQIASFVFRPSADAALLFLVLTALSAARRPPFAGLLAAAACAFLAADLLYLNVRSGGFYRLGDWPELVWALGLLLLGVAALRPGLAPDGIPQKPGIGSLRQAAFWFGPLSPFVHYAALLGYAAFVPSARTYVLAGGMGLMAYAILRLSVFAGVSEGLRTEQVILARRAEQDRLRAGLHDDVKQSVYGISAILTACKKAHDRGDTECAARLLDRAIAASREANYRVSRPVGELCARRDGDRPLPALLDEVLSDAECYFGLKAHKRLRCPLDGLRPDERAVAYRVIGEAVRNAARHSGAENVWVESDGPSDAPTVFVRDDGRGFLPADAGGGMGLSLMRERAEEAGAELDVVSAPGRGTIVRLAFRGTGS
jgi:signal transduction histidine kinase